MIGTPTYQVTARLDADGEPSAKVTAFCDYGNRSASYSQDITDEKTLASIGAALKRVVTKDVQAELEPLVTRSAMQGYMIAVDKGEDVSGQSAATEEK